MHYILWGLGLTTITLRFLNLDVILTAVGAALLVLGFRILRRENASLRWGFRLTLAALAVRSTCYVLAALPVEAGMAPAYTAMALQLAVYVCLWRGMIGVSRSAGAEKPQAYRYPHNYPHHYVEQRYLPEELGEKHYYEYGDNKTEQAAKRYWDEIKK